MAKTNKVYKSSKSSKKKIVNTQYDKRFTQANRINNMNESCVKCGTEVISSRNIKEDDIEMITVRCSTYSHTFEIKYCFGYQDAFYAFIDNHP